VIAAHIVAADPFALPPVTAAARDPFDSPILHLLLAARALTSSEWAEIEAAENRVTS
jgi:hypothetical protein